MITEVDTIDVAKRGSALYLAFIFDTHSRRIVRWAMECHLSTELVIDALDSRMEKIVRSRSSSPFRPKRPARFALSRKGSRNIETPRPERPVEATLAVAMRRLQAEVDRGRDHVRGADRVGEIEDRATPAAGGIPRRSPEGAQVIENGGGHSGHSASESRWQRR